MRNLLAAAILLFSLSGPVLANRPAHHKSSHSTGAVVSTEVKRTARQLAHAWVNTASPATLDQLAARSIAFAGMVPGLYVTLDGKRFSANQALTDSGLTILNQNTHEADATAIRNTVYVLMEIAEGRVRRGR